MTNERDVVQSLDRALSILDALSFAESDLELREVAVHTKLPKSTVHRLLSTLELRGYVTRDPTTGRYRAALKMFRYLGWGPRIHEVLARLANRSGETANLGILTGSEVTYVARADSPHALRWQLGVGSRVPAHCSAMGKVILAHAGSGALDRSLSSPLRRLTSKTIVDRDLLIRELERTRARGCALDNEEFMEGVRCVAVPVWATSEGQPYGQPAGAISLSGPAFRFPEEAAIAQVPMLIDAAEEVSALVDDGARTAVALGEAQ